MDPRFPVRNKVHKLITCSDLKCLFWCSVQRNSSMGSSFQAFPLPPPLSRRRGKRRFTWSSNTGFFGGGYFGVFIFTHIGNLGSSSLACWLRGPGIDPGVKQARLMDSNFLPSFLPPGRRVKIQHSLFLYPILLTH